MLRRVRLNHISLFFEEDLKGEMMRIMTNIRMFHLISQLLVSPNSCTVRFSPLIKGKQADVNPLILLYGAPGTGKTSLCQGLAQKIAIRMVSKYEQTKLIQIKTATLLSKFYSEYHVMLC